MSSQPTAYSRARRAAPTRPALLVTSVLVGLLVAAGPSAAEQSPGGGRPADDPTPLELDLRFETLRATRSMGRIQMTYEVAAGDWERLREADISLFISMWIPNDGAPGGFAYAYHMPLDERAGQVDFPEWLDTLAADRVGLCPLGARPYDNLGLGRGYACDSLVLTSLRPEATSPGPVDFQMTYYGGMPYYGYFPWKGPYL